MPVLKILSVDDDKDDQFMLKKIFKTLVPSAEIVQAYNGVECIAYLEANAGLLPSLITMDLNMPLVNGIEATATLKQDERFRHIPVVILTTSDRGNDKVMTMNKGADDFFTKPVIYNELQLTIKTIVDKWLGKLLR